MCALALKPAEPEPCPGLPAAEAETVADIATGTAEAAVVVVVEEGSETSAQAPVALDDELLAKAAEDATVLGHDGEMTYLAQFFQGPSDLQDVHELQQYAQRPPLFARVVSKMYRYRGALPNIVDTEMPADKMLKLRTLFGRIPYTVVSRKDTLIASFASWFFLTIGLALWGMADKGAADVPVIARVPGVWFWSVWSWVFHFELCFNIAIHGYITKRAGIMSLIQTLAFGLPLLIPVGESDQGNAVYAGWVTGSLPGSILGFNISTSCVIGLHAAWKRTSGVRRDRIKAVLRAVAAPIVDVNIAVGLTVPSFIGYMLLEKLVLEKLNAFIASLTLPIIVSVMELAFVHMHGLVMTHLIWRWVERGNHEGGDHVTFTCCMVGFQHAVAESCRFALLMLSAIERPADFDWVASLCVSLVLNLAKRAHWQALMEYKFAKCLGVLWVPDPWTFLHLAHKKSMGYPRYFGMASIFAARWVITGSVVEACFCTKTLGPLLLFAASLAIEVLEDVLVECLEAKAWMPDWMHIDPKVAAMHQKVPLDHPERLDGMRQRGLRAGAAPAVMAHFVVGNATMWTVLFMGLLMGFRVLLGVCNTRNAVGGIKPHIQAITLFWPHEEIDCSY